MFGVRDKYHPERIIPLKTQYMEVLDSNELPEDMFHLVTIGSGTVVTEIDEHVCHISGQSILCLDERRKFRVKAGHATDIKAISFSPEFLNVNMKPELLRSTNYNTLCDIHSFFQLSPFLTENTDKIAFRICDDTFSKFTSAIDQIEKNLSYQPDWYWSCRARSYFIDIINILERTFHNYYLPELSEDNLYPVKLQKDFRGIIVYINNHLNEKITLDGLYKRFLFNKNKMQSMFHDYLSQSLQEYLNQRRFEEASYYLRFTDLTGDEIADRLSFSGSSYFSRFFARMCGQAPDEFRKEMVVRRKADMNELRQIEEEGRRFREAVILG